MRVDGCDELGRVFGTEGCELFVEFRNGQQRHVMIADVSRVSAEETRLEQLEWQHLGQTGSDKTYSKQCREIVIGAVTLKNVTAAREYVRELVARCRLGEPITDLHDAMFVRALLQRHPSVQEKIGRGVRHIEVRLNKHNGKANRGFWIVRTDGSELEFSWLECLKPTAHRNKVYNAMRAAVQDDVYEFKRRQFTGVKTVKCALTGAVIGMTDADVHHEPPFKQLVDEFVQGKFDDVQVDDGHSSAQFGDRLVDECFIERWRKYHDEKAGLRIVKRESHQALPRRQDHYLDEAGYNQLIQELHAEIEEERQAASGRKGTV